MPEPMAPPASTPLDPDFKNRADAFAVYDDLRRNAPVSATVLPDGTPMWLVARHEDALAVLRDDERFCNDAKRVMTPEQYAAAMAEAVRDLPPEQQARFAEIDAVLSTQLLAIDPPDHTRLRRLVSRSFTPRLVEALRPRVQQIADDLIDAIEAEAVATGRRETNLVDTFAFPLPIIVISEMLGVPHEDRDRFREWSNAVVQFNVTEPIDTARMALLGEFTDYLHAFLAAKRARPADDLVSGLVRDEEEGDRLSEPELVSLIFLLVVAGHETTVNLIGNGLLALFDHPEQLALLRRDPSLTKPAVEEMLRFWGPVETSITRFAHEDAVLAGQAIGRGEPLTVLLASANHDPAQFADPERFDITREPGRHLAFGWGIHACLGSLLARLEAQVAFTTLLARFPELHLAAPRESLRWRQGSLLRGLEALPVAF